MLKKEKVKSKKEKVKHEVRLLLSLFTFTLLLNYAIRSF